VRALTFHGPGAVRCESVPDPTIAAPGDAIVRVELAAICGSDLHVWRGHERGLDAGTVLGHELLGEVVETGAGVRDVRRGMRVVAPFTTSCGECFYCARGLTCRCPRGELFGWVQDGRGLHGAQAEYVRVPLADATLSAVPAGVAPAAVLFCGDIVATGLFCAASGDVRPGAVVAVIGCGPVGLMAALAARWLGAERVFAIDDVPERLRLATRYGAEAIDRSAAAPRDVVLDATEGRGAGSVLEAVGSPAATRLAFELVRPGGTIAACGVHTESAFAFTPGEAYDKNLTYRAGRCPARQYFDRALALARAHERDLLALVSHTLPLEDGPRGYEMFDRKQQGCTKVLLTPGT
jgi:threonine dehydrogenase-like Zn-dependent dehydrogenase